MGNCRHGDLLSAATVVVLRMATILSSDYMCMSRAKEAARVADAYAVRRAVDAYTSDKGHKPKFLEDLVRDGYLLSIPGAHKCKPDPTNEWDPIPSPKESFVTRTDADVRV